MAKIALSNTAFALVPEGTHIFKITEVEYKEAFGKLEITLVTKRGEKHIERFAFVKNDGKPNEAAINVFSYFAKVALQDFDLEEIDHEDLVGRYIKAEVTHETVENKNDPTKTVTFSRLGQKYAADGYDDDDEVAPVKTEVKPAAKPTAKPAPAAAVEPAKKKVDLASILGRK